MAADIEPPPRIGTSLNTDFISGMGKHRDEFIIILDVDRLFTCEEREVLLDADVEQQAANA